MAYLNIRAPAMEAGGISGVLADSEEVEGWVEGEEEGLAVAAATEIHRLCLPCVKGVRSSHIICK
jgi:hypothetical protein